MDITWTKTTMGYRCVQYPHVSLVPFRANKWSMTNTNWKEFNHLIFGTKESATEFLANNDWFATKDSFNSPS